MSAAGRGIGSMVNLARQRQQTLIFIVQEARQLDVNVISQADVIVVKELSEISRDFERKELKRYTDKARAAFSTVKGNRQRWAWVHSEAADFEGLVENELATFWRPALSHAFANAGTNESQATARKGTRTPRQDLVAHARELVQLHGYGKAATLMGLPKSTVWDLLNRPGSPGA